MLMLPWRQLFMLKETGSLYAPLGRARTAANLDI